MSDDEGSYITSATAEPSKGKGVAGPASAGLHREPARPCQDGVFSLPAKTQAQIGTILRVLFQVRSSRDQSIMPFFAMAQYMMAIFLPGRCHDGGGQDVLLR